MIADDATFLSEHGGVDFKDFRYIFANSYISLGDEAKFVVARLIEVDNVVVDEDVGVIGIDGKTGGNNSGFAIEGAVDPNGVLDEDDVQASDRLGADEIFVFDIFKEIFAPRFFGVALEGVGVCDFVNIKIAVVFEN